MKKEILLPGGIEQYEFLTSNISLKGMRVLVAGASAEPLAEKISKEANVEIIVDDYESLISANLYLRNKIAVKLMDFSVTDYDPETFDLIYAQASVSSINRNKIFKELKRILKPEGILCVGEIFLKKENPPQFIKDILEDSNQLILTAEDLEKYYRERNFKIMEMKNLSDTLEEYYSSSRKKLRDSLGGLSDEEKSYYKKLLNKISHETNAFLKQGADKYLGLKTFLLKKGN